MNTLKHISRFAMALALALAISAPIAGTSSADEPAETCVANLTIFTTSIGTRTDNGRITRFRDSGVAGQYTSGILSGYTFTGSQDILINNVTNTAQIIGSYTATGPGGTLVVRYSGHANLATGAATGHFTAGDGTGDFEGFHWSGSIDGQMTSFTPPTFVVTHTGPCH